MFHVMVKPIGATCNLRCAYCFYLEKLHARSSGPAAGRMADGVLEQFIREYIREHPQGAEIEFAWQGGEPTLLGVDFFRRVVELQKRYGAGRPVRNALQTNGTLLDDAWGDFLAREKFLVGLSLDGPEPIHNRYRVDREGQGSFARVMRGMEVLRRHGVAFNVLTCVTRESAREGRKIYRFLRAQGVEFMQFIPIVERVPDARAEAEGWELGLPPDLETVEPSREVMPFTVEPEAFGQFLIDVFDLWVRQDVGRIFVNHFDVALAAWLGMPPSLCVYAKTCGTALALEHDGSLYACDHFVYPQYARGNVMDGNLAGLADSAQQRAFGQSKSTALPRCCRECPVLAACHGGCLKHRFMTSPEGEPGLNYLCPGMRLYLKHIDPYMQRMAELLRQGRPAAEIMPECATTNRPKRSGKKGKRSR